VTAVLGGLGAAGAWALTTLCYSLAARTLDSASALALVMLVGLAIAAPATALGGVPHDLDADALGLLLLAGSANVAGLLLVITALRIGKVGIVAPIVSTEGALAAVIAVVAGEAIDPGAGATLALIATGIALASSGRDRLDEASDASQPTRAVLVAIAAALTFAVGLYATGKVSEELPLVWALLPARVSALRSSPCPYWRPGGSRRHAPRHRSWSPPASRKWRGSPSSPSGHAMGSRSPRCSRHSSESSPRSPRSSSSASA
jgi:drug/metabolite transporter (DMT)-like permease